MTATMTTLMMMTTTRKMGRKINYNAININKIMMITLLITMTITLNNDGDDTYYQVFRT